MHAVVHAVRKFAGNTFLEADFANQTFYVIRVYHWGDRSNRNSLNIFEITVNTAGLLIGQRVNRQSES